MYFDPGIAPDFGNPEITEDLFASLPFFGIRKCFVICDLDTLPLVSSIQQRFPALFIYSRVVMGAESVNALKASYKKCRGKFDIFSVESTNPEVLNFAARDSRFHILSFTTKAEWNVLNSGIASLAAQFTTGIEFPLKFLLRLNNASSLYIRLCRKAITIARLGHAPILFSSHAQSKYDLIGGKEIKSLANSVFDIPLPIGKKITSAYPQAILDMHPANQNGGQSPDGVRVISRLNEEVDGLR
ncbi:MAG TPA: RNase P subunit p30 family protein [Candidatus Lokiarchaeia archaeon]|nr:RNase P subunit p30 family protein [Candidatus Lokiarchaeia archaeon]